jgi:DNA end-binding protein Ku
MLQIAEKIIAQQEGRFDPSHFKDRYEDALRALIERKKKGKPIEAEAPDAKDSNVVDLMEALRSSLKGSRRPTAKRHKAAHKRAA